jgi:hypothetical protein
MKTQRLAVVLTLLNLVFLLTQGRLYIGSQGVGV